MHELLQLLAQRQRLQRRQGYRMGPELPSFPQPWLPQRSQLFGIGGDFDRLPGVPGLLRGSPFTGGGRSSGAISRSQQRFF